MQDNTGTDVAIITIKEEEFEATISALGLDESRPASETRGYLIGRAQTPRGSLTVAVTRCPAQGNGVAQDVARDLLDDLRPRWVFLVGIAGAVPGKELCLGDVALAGRVFDFSVEAIKSGTHTYAVAEIPLHEYADNLLTLRAAWESRIGGWFELGLNRPALEPVPGENYIYGTEEWQKDVREAIDWLKARRPARPRARVVSVAASDRLIKDDEILSVWLKVARTVSVVEMESAGVHRAARGRGPRRPAYPVISVRGISDVVGFKRDEAWTLYACASAAAYTSALIRSGVLEDYQNYRSGEPLRDTSGGPRGVPALPRHHMERAADIRKLEDASAPAAAIDSERGAQRHQVIAIRGIPGSGKSVLASAFAHREGTLRTFPDGVVWVYLGQEPNVKRSLTQACRDLGAGLPADAADTRDEQERLRKLLSGKTNLLVLDDAWDVPHVEPFVNALGPRSTLLLTTREGSLVTALGAHEIVLGRLAHDEALRLLSAWSEVDLGAMPAAASEVAARCGRLPLTLALCGAMVRDGLTWADILVALNEVGVGFIQRDLPNYPYRDAMLAIEASIKHLRSQDPEGAGLYTKLSLFVDLPSVPVATVLMLWLNCGRSELAGKRLLVALERKCLLNLEGAAAQQHVVLHDLHQDYLRIRYRATPTDHSELVEAYRGLCPDGWHSGPNDGYFFWHIHRDLLAAGRDRELLELARDNAFLLTQARRSPTAPLDTIATALQAAARNEDSRAMAELCLARARRVTELRLESVFDTLRASGVEAAWSVADHCEPEPRVLWYLLLASRLLDLARREEARRTLDRLLEGQRTRLSAHGSAAALLLPHVLDLDEHLFVQLYESFLDYSAMDELCTALARDGRFEEACKIAERAREGRRALPQIALRRIDHGELEAAQQMVETLIGDEWERERVLAELATAYARAGNLSKSWQIATRLTNAYWLSTALASVSSYAAERAESFATAKEALDVAINTLPKTREDGPKPRLEWPPAADANFQETSDRLFDLATNLTIAEAETTSAIAIAGAIASIALSASRTGSTSRLSLQDALQFARAHSIEERRARALAEVALVQRRYGREDAAHETLSAARQVAGQADSWANAYAGLAKALARGQWSEEASIVLRLAGEEARRRTSKIDRAVFTVIARAQLEVGDWETGKSTLAALLAQGGNLEAADEGLAGRAKALARIARVLARADQIVDAQRVYLAALDAAKQIQTDARQLEALSEVAFQGAHVGYFAEAVDAARAIRWPGRSVEVLVQVAEIQAHSDPPAARALLMEELASAEQSSGLGLPHVAAGLVRTGYRDEGRQVFEKAINRARIQAADDAASSSRGAADLLRDWVVVFPIVQQQAAVGLIDEALQTSRLLTQDSWRAEASRVLAEAWARAGAAEKAVDAAARSGDRMAALSLSEVATVLVDRGDGEGARAALSRARQAFQKLGPDDTSEPWVLIGEAQAKLGELNEAKTSFAVGLGGALESPSLEARERALERIAMCQITSGFIDDAIRTGRYIQTPSSGIRIAEALAVLEDRGPFKQWVVICSNRLESAYNACALLAVIYKDAALSIAERLLSELYSEPQRDRIIG